MCDLSIPDVLILECFSIYSDCTQTGSEDFGGEDFYYHQDFRVEYNLISIKT